MKSVGDFYVNIIPKLDQIALNTGISAVNSTMEIARKMWSGGKKVFNWFDDIAKTTRDLKHFSDTMLYPIQQIEKLQRMMFMFSGDKGGANSMLVSLMTTVHRMRTWGEGAWREASKYGLTGVSNNPEVAMLQIRKALLEQKTGAARLEAGNVFGLDDQQIEFLTMAESKWQRISEYADRMPRIDNKIASNADMFEENVAKLEIAKEVFSRDLLLKAVPALTSIIEKLDKLISDPKTMELFTRSLDTMLKIASIMIDFARITGIGSSRDEQPKPLSSRLPNAPKLSIFYQGVLGQYLEKTMHPERFELVVSTEPTENFETFIRESGNNAVNSLNKTRVSYQINKTVKNR